MKLKMPLFERARVLVVGDVMLDRYWHGPSSRISPEAPVPVVNITQTEDRPGGAANVALNLAALGCQVKLLGIVGNDDAGQILQRQLNAAHIRCDLLCSTTKPTITKLRVMSRHQQLLRMDFEEKFSAEDAESLAGKLPQHLDNIDILVISDYAKGSLANVQQLIRLAKLRHIPILVDPKAANYSIYTGATILTPNYAEFEQVVGRCRSEQDIAEKALALVQELQLQALLITRGEQGMTLVRPDHKEMHLPARAREVFDVTGAGDTVIASLAAAMAAGETLPAATGLANLAASVVVGKLGTATLSAPELRGAIYAEQGFSRGILSEEQLQLALADARLNGEQIVFTNGCFDIIHAGHVSYLEEARKLGHRLVVAINSDASVRRLKGEGRPINSQDRRMTVLAGLESVDWVVSFSEDTPERLLQRIKPDVLVKGGDYSEEQVVGAEFVKSYGGEVQVLGFFDNCSTTAIVNKIRTDTLLN